MGGTHEAPLRGYGNHGAPWSLPQALLLSGGQCQQAMDFSPFSFFFFFEFPTTLWLVVHFTSEQAVVRTTVIVVWFVFTRRATALKFPPQPVTTSSALLQCNVIR